MKSLNLYLFILLASISSKGVAQEVFVYFEKDINFGEFYASGNSGGSICIPNNGGINASPNINLLRSDYQPATVVISTTSEKEVDIQIEARAERLKSNEGGSLRLVLNEPDRTLYTIRRGRPVEINLGGCLEIDAKAAGSSGDHFGSISVLVTILNE